MGMQHEQQFSGIIGAQSDDVVKSSSKPIAVAAACSMLPSGVLVMGIDDTIERRRASELQPRVSIVTQSVPVIATWSKPVVCGG